MSAVRDFDTTVTKLVARLPAALTRPFKLVGLLTSPLAWFIIIPIVTLLRQPTDLQPVVIVLLCMPLATIIKFAFRRSRPPTIYAGTMRVKSYSFPSSHSYAAALSCTFLATQAFADGLAALTPLLALLALAVGLSRIFLGAHYPSDVVAGLLFGVLIGVGVALWA